MKNLSGAILVGLSTRMGQDKALLTLNQETFISHLARELSVCDEVFLCETLDHDYSEYGLPVIRDEHQGIGPMEGIRRSLFYAAYDHVFICAVDMPFVRGEMILCLKRFISPDYDIYVYKDGDRVHPLCGIYSKRVLPAVGRLIGEGRYRMMDLLGSVPTRYIDIADSGFSGDMLRNINTPEEYRAICNERKQIPSQSYLT